MIGPIVSESIERLEVGVDLLTRQLKRPLFIADDRPRFRFVSRTSQVVQILKAVRVVSGFHAYVSLATAGFVQEAFVVLRSVYECLEDIEFLDEAHTSGNPTAGQKQLVETFFAEGDHTVDDFLAGRATPRPRTTRREKRAAVTRLLGGFSNPERVRRILEAIANGLDGYVHAAYPHIMEMYGGTPPEERFHMRGMSVRERTDLAVRYLALLVHQALNNIAKLLIDTGNLDDANKLLDLRRRLEVSAEYKST